MSDFKTFNIGTVRLIYDSVDLGKTLDAINISFSEDAETVTFERFGQTAYEEVIVGSQCQVTGQIGDATLEQLAKISGGTINTGAAHDELILKSRVGTNLITLAKTLILKPEVQQTPVTEEWKWYYLPKAGIRANWDTQMGLSAQSGYAFTATAYPVRAEDIASGGVLAGESYPENTLMRIGKAD